MWPSNTIERNLLHHIQSWWVTSSDQYMLMILCVEQVTKRVRTICTLIQKKCWRVAHSTYGSSLPTPCPCKSASTKQKGCLSPTPPPPVKQSCSDTDETIHVGQCEPSMSRRTENSRSTLECSLRPVRVQLQRYVATDVEPTKWNVATVGWFYDPLGFISSIVIRFKVLFQKLCEAKMPWDQPLEGKLLSR